MRNPSIAIAVLLAFACGGEDGPRGSAAAPCTATWDASGWTLRCPDGTEWTEAPRACDVVEEEGVRIVRCADGTEAVLAPPGVQGAGVVEGVVRLASHGPVAGAVVEVIDTDARATTDANGAYRLEDVPAGTWTLRAAIGPWPAVERQIVVLPGVQLVDPLEIAVGTELPQGTFEVLPGGREIVHLRGERLVVIHDLATGKEHRLEEWVVNLMSLGGEAVFLEGFSPDRFGFWSPDLGFVWWNDLGVTALHRGGNRILAVRGNGSVWIHGPEGMMRVEDAPRGGSWQGAGGRAIWRHVGGGRVVLVDATGGEPVVRTLVEREPVEAQIGVDGTHLRARFEDGEVVHYSLVTDDVVDVPAGAASVQISGEFMTWIDGAQRTIHDLRTGHRRQIDADVAWGWSQPARRWFWYEVAPGSWRIESREGEEVATIAGAPIFSPDETRFAAIVGDTLVVREAGAGGEQSFPVVHGEEVAWLDEERLFLHGAGPLRVATWDGAVRTIVADAAAYQYQVQDGRLLVSWGTDGGALREASIRDLETLEETPLGTGYDFVLRPGGGHVVWRSVENTLWLRSLGDGAALRIAEGVESAVGLRNVVVWQGAPPGGGSVRSLYAPYP